MQYDIDHCVKCVVVGDAGVGKTCLTCAWACGTKYNLKQLVKTHVSTVWAIDHYRTDESVLKNSWCEVDRARVSLRLWDTFGYHDKNRSFAYARADVVLLCFSLTNPTSLTNVRRHWITEISYYCPTSPVVLVGTQADMRYLYNDDEYQHMRKGLMYRSVTKDDILYPANGRSVAQELGVPYYESSVLNHHSVNEVFDNVIRAALCDKLRLRFWSPILRNLQRPLIQEPMPLPKTRSPLVSVRVGSIERDFAALYDGRHSDFDVTFRFVTSSVTVHAHRVMLAFSADVFSNLFTLYASSKTSISLLLDGSGDAPCVADDEIINANHDLKFDIESFYWTACDQSGRPTIKYTLNHSAIRSVAVTLDVPRDGYSNQQTIVTMDAAIMPESFEKIVEFLYTGRMDVPRELFENVRLTADMLNLVDLVELMQNPGSESTCFVSGRYFSTSLHQRFHQISLDKSTFSDISFQLEDGVVSCHRSVLMSRCDVMAAMFSEPFLESTLRLVPFPETSVDTFRAVLEFIYVDEQPCMTGVDCMALLEVANRLCLSRLVDLTENYVVQELTKARDMGEDILDDVMPIVELAKLVNAHQLLAWCLHHLATHFVDVTKKHSKQWKALPRDVQLFIDRNRWPPLWYLKEKELFDKMRDHMNAKTLRHSFKHRHSVCGCSCFGLRKSKKDIKPSLFNYI